MADSWNSYVISGIVSVAVTTVGYFLARPVQRQQVRTSAAQELATLNESQARTIADLREEVDKLKDDVEQSEKTCRERMAEMDRTHRAELDRMRREHNAERTYLKNRVDELNDIVLRIRSDTPRREP